MVSRPEKLTIRDLRARAVCLPLRRPLATRVGAFTHWSLILIDLQVEEGLVGRAYITPYLKQAAAYLIPLLQDLAGRFKGRPAAPTEIFQEGRRALSLLGLQGLSFMALAGLDMALWDLLAKAAGRPLAALLGGTVGPVRAYNSDGLGLMPPDQAAREALELLAEGGFRALKVRLGRETLAQDLAALRAVRRAVGDGIILVGDFNQGLTLGEALLRCQALDQENVYWIEEPLAYDDLEGHARLASKTATPIQLGENFYGPQSLNQALAAKACDYVMPDLMRIGGVTGWLRAAALAEAAGKEMSSHLFPEISSHLMRVTPTAHWLEWVTWAHPVLARPFQVRDGHVHIPDVPGNGLEWDEAAVARYAY